MAVLVLIASPVIARAGVFSYLSSLFSNTKENSAVVPDNVQTIELLQADVSPNPELSRGGADITIVDGSALVSEAAPGSSDESNIHRPSSDQISVYVVHEGDSLSAIAEMFDVTVNTIRWTNDLKPGQALKKGQVLTILPISGVRHVVKKGDTIASIAKKYKGDAEEIRSYNNIQAETLALGEVVIIPDGEIAVEPKKVASTSLKAGISSSVPNIVGYFMRPLSTGVRTQGIHGFNGVDLAAAVGTPVYASAAGQVIISRTGGWNGGYGNYVVIAHSNGTQTLYAHLSSTAVSQGQTVSQGEVVGYLGNTGKSTGPHLHFEVRGAKNPF